MSVIPRRSLRPLAADLAWRLRRWTTRRLARAAQARSERRALLDVLARPDDRLLSDAGLDREAVQRGLDVQPISAWDRWQG